ncbi:MAG: DedA family protein, partial [Nocardioidaceae bacterium]
GLVLLEDFGVPAPGGKILIASAVYPRAGQRNNLLGVLVAFVGAVLGDNIGFAIGSYGGRRLVLRWGRYVFVTEERLRKAERFVDRHGGKIVVVARFIEGLRQLNGIVAGISDMRWRAFAVFNAVGAALWVGVWASVGYFAGDHIDAVYGQAQRYSMYLLIAVAVLLVALVLRAVVRRRRESEPEVEQEESASS